MAFLDKRLMKMEQKVQIDDIPLRMGCRNISPWNASWGPGLFSSSLRYMSSGGGGNASGGSCAGMGCFFGGGCVVFR